MPVVSGPAALRIHAEVERSVVLDFAFIDNDRATTQCLDVFHIVTGQQHGHLLLGLVMAQKALDFSL